MKYVIEMIITDERGNTMIETLPCQTIEDFNVAKKAFENKELTLKLYECKEIEMKGNQNG